MKKEKFHTYPWYSPRFWHGMTLQTWAKFLLAERLQVDWQRLHLATSVSLITGTNTVLAGLQNLIYNRRIESQHQPHDPIFILGHWRSGTTHLHELLIHDTRFGYPTTYECFAPQHFLLTEWCGPVMNWLLPNKRPMDNMPAGFDHPQEDEFALCNLGAGSPYEQIGFPNRPARVDDFLNLEAQTPAQQAHWRKTMQWFVRRVQFRQPEKTLVFKSPPHTARIKTLLELYPTAKFIHIVRDPLSVYPSTIRLWKSLFNVQGLQVPTFEQLPEYVLNNFERMYENVERDRPLLNKQNFHELRYEDLVSNPIQVLAELYSSLELGDFAQVQPQMQQYLDSQKSYQTNQHQMDAETTAIITKRWGRYMQRYGYLSNASTTTTTPASTTTTIHPAALESSQTREHLHTLETIPMTTTGSRLQQPAA